MVSQAAGNWLSGEPHLSACARSTSRPRSGRGAGAHCDRGLLAVLAEWNSAASYHARVNRVGATFDAFDDGAKDTLTGGTGRDWLFTNLNSGVRDCITDLVRNEIVVEL